MAAAIWDFTIEQGTTFTRPLKLRDGMGDDLPITDYVFRGQLRAAYSDPLPAAAILCVVEDGPAGIFRITLSDTVTAGLSAGKVYVYDIEMVNPAGEVARLVQGKIKVSPEATK